MEKETVSIETEAEKMAARIESRVIDGKKCIVTPEEREKLRKAVESRGVDLQIFMTEKAERLRQVPEGVGRSSRQAKELEVILGGRGALIGYCQEMLLGCVSETRQEEAAGYVEKYFSDHTTNDGYLHFPKGESLLKNRLEAIISTTHNLMELAAQYSEMIADEWMESEEFNHCLRERVLRGWEKTGKVEVPLNREVPRKKDKIIRSLPVGSLKKMVEYFIVNR